MPGRLLLFGRDRSVSPKAPGRTSRRFSGSAKEHTPNMDIFKRHGQAQGKRLTDNKASAKYESKKLAELDLLIESPSLVMYHTPEQSSGALFSAKLKVIVPKTEIALESLNMRLVSVATYKMPFMANCPACAKQETELQRWAFLKEPVKLKAGDHHYPFSKLFPGNLPATTSGINQHIEYRLYAVANLGSGNEFRLDWPISLTRALRSGQDRESTRIFPPTDLTMSITMNPIIHPVSDLPFTMRLTNLLEKDKDSHLRWRLMRINWRIEETEKVISPPCPKHAATEGTSSFLQQGTPHTYTRCIGQGEFSRGWKSDFVQDVIEGEFTAAVNGNVKPCCDVEVIGGISITHKLYMEAIISQERVSDIHVAGGTLTGTNRVLRCNFGVQLTEKSGLGISWDEEAPPLYEDVPASPPTYARMIDYTGPTLDEDQINL